jgi:hypothetical protein
MKTTNPVDAARIELALSDLHLRRHQIDVGEARRAIRQGRLAGRPLPCRARRARDRRSRASPHRVFLTMIGEFWLLIVRGSRRMRA